MTEKSAVKKSYWWEAFWMSFASIWYIPYTRGWKVGMKAILVIAIILMNNMFMVSTYSAFPKTEEQMLMHWVFTFFTIVSMGLIGAYVLRDVPRVPAKFYLKFGRAFAISMILTVIITGATFFQTVQILEKMQPPAPATYELPKTPNVEL